MLINLYNPDFLNLQSVAFGEYKGVLHSTKQLKLATIRSSKRGRGGLPT